MSLVSPVVDSGLGNTSWVVDLGEGRLAVVDPGRHPGPYLAEAERRGARVAYSIETHLHADFVTGSRELARFGTEVVASAGAELGSPARSLTGGEALDLGGSSRPATRRWPSSSAGRRTGRNAPAGV